MLVSAWAILPFACLLLCIAVFPRLRVTAHLWERRTFQLAVSLAFALPVAIWLDARGDTHALIHALVEYAQFITLLFSLFVVSGGIFLSGDIPATPRTNTLFLAAGALAASFVGTTGAAMLLVRPLLNVNEQRKHKTHTVVFTILIVANAGGLLTPLGDPPLFLGFLRGVPFSWTFTLFPEWLFVNGLLLLAYYTLDCRAYAQEPEPHLLHDRRHVKPLRLRGAWNIGLFAVVVGAVALLPSVNLEAILAGQTRALAWLPAREIVLFATAIVSYRLSDRRTRFVDNRFNWAPIAEVAALFVGIFVTMDPALRYVGQIAPTLPVGPISLFVASGSLSSVLDNAPTYATFFEIARQVSHAGPRIAGVPEVLLVAISLGAVLCGANTYIGNGPNFMVKSIADSRGVAMPSFGGFLVRWVLIYYIPVLALMCLVFLAQHPVLRAAGIGGTVLFAVLCIRTALSPRQHATAPATRHDNHDAERYRCQAPPRSSR